jgi:hypothetical protein
LILGRVLHTLGQLEPARYLLQTALAAAQKAFAPFAPEHRLVTTIQKHLADVLRQLENKTRSASDHP